MGILYVIQEDQKRIFPFIPGRLQQILHLRILVGRHVGDYPLMVSGQRKLIQPLFFYVVYRCILLGRFPADCKDRPVLTASQEKQPLYLPAGAVSLQNRIPAFQNTIFLGPVAL